MPNPVHRLLSRTRRTGRLSGSSGTSIMEVTVATAVLMIILAPALLFLTMTQKNEVNVSNETGQQADARVALGEITRFLRQAEYPGGTSSTTTGSDMFYTASSYDIAFYSEMGSAKSDGTIYKIEYSLSGTTLTRTVTTPDCSVSPCSYDPVSDHLVTQKSRTLFTDFRNLTTTGCTNFSSSVPLFNFYQEDPGTGQLTSISSTGNLGLINYVQIVALTGLSTNQAPGCTEIQTAVSLRNWRSA